MITDIFGFLTLHLTQYIHAPLLQTEEGGPATMLLLDDSRIDQSLDMSCWEREGHGLEPHSSLHLRPALGEEFVCEPSTDDTAATQGQIHWS